MGQLFLALTGPIVIRALLTLGVGVVTFTGLTSVLALVWNSVNTGFSSLPADVMNLVFLSGVPQGTAIILSALAGRLTMMQMSKIQKLA